MAERVEILRDVERVVIAAGLRVYCPRRGYAHRGVGLHWTDRIGSPWRHSPMLTVEDVLEPSDG